jgi:hypothetical protein
MLQVNKRKEYIYVPYVVVSKLIIRIDDRLLNCFAPVIMDFVNHCFSLPQTCLGLEGFVVVVAEWSKAPVWREDRFLNYNFSKAAPFLLTCRLFIKCGKEMTSGVCSLRWRGWVIMLSVLHSSFFVCILQ